jgi:hypothetical protein
MPNPTYTLCTRRAERLKDSLLKQVDSQAVYDRAHAAPASIYKSMDYNRELRRQGSLQDLVYQLLRRLKYAVFNDFANLNLTRGVDCRIVHVINYFTKR